MTAAVATLTLLRLILPRLIPVLHVFVDVR